MNYDELKIIPQFAKSAVCCFTGNRPYKLPWGTNEADPRFLAVRAKLCATIDKLIEEGYSLFVGGMAQGGDTYFAEAVLEAKKRHSGVFLECAVPCPEQADAWDGAAKRRYKKILAAADFVTVLQPSYTRACMLRRNRYMADKSSVIVTLDYSGDGGTKYTVDYAEKLGLRILPLAGD